MRTLYSATKKIIFGNIPLIPRKNRRYNEFDMQLKKCPNYPRYHIYIFFHLYGNALGTYHLQHMST